MTDLSKFDAPPPRASEPEWGREDFLNTLVGTLSETIEQVVGLNDAETFIGMVGRRMGQSAAARLPCQGKATPEEVAEHLRSFKASIGGKPCESPIGAGEVRIYVKESKADQDGGRGYP